MNRTIRYIFATALVPALLACGKEEPDYSKWYQTDSDGSSGTPVDPAEQTARSIAVMSFNVKNYKDNANTENSWDNRRAGIYEMLGTEKPVAVGLQECYISQRDDITRNCTEYEAYGKGREDGLSAGETTSILYMKDSLKVVQSGTFWLSETPNEPSVGWDAKFERTVTWMWFRHIRTGDEFLMFNTHLDHVGVTAKTESLELIEERIKSINTKNLPVILTGDFNTETSDEAFSALTLSDARKDAPASDNFDTTNDYGGGSTSQIDHIFYQDLEPVSFETVRDRWAGITYISDHYPVLAKFNFNEETDKL